GAVDVAVLLGAVDADAVEWIARDLCPQHLLTSVEAELRAVAALGGVQPDEHLELEGQLLCVLAGLRKEPPPPAERDIVGAALEEAGLELPWQPLAQAREVFAHQLFLERVRVRRHHDPL